MKCNWSKLIRICDVRVNRELEADFKNILRIPLNSSQLRFMEKQIKVHFRHVGLSCDCELLSNEITRSFTISGRKRAAPNHLSSLCSFDLLSQTTGTCKKHFRPSRKLITSPVADYDCGNKIKGLRFDKETRSRNFFRTHKQFLHRESSEFAMWLNLSSFLPALDFFK